MLAFLEFSSLTVMPLTFDDFFMVILFIVFLILQPKPYQARPGEDRQ